MTDSERQQLRKRIIATYWQLHQQRTCHSCPPEPPLNAASADEQEPPRSDD